MSKPVIRLLIVGASVRLAAHSALRAGFSVEACDLFGDADLQRSCPATTIKEYPRAFAAAVERSDCDAWLYTGGLENYPRLVDRMARIKPLWGNRSEALRRVRDPALLSDLCQRHGIPFPEWRIVASDLPVDGTWLSKGRRSSGGLQVRRWTGATSKRGASASYFQRYVAGLSSSAVFVAAAGKGRLLGTSRQLLECDFSGGESFRYAGSIAPLQLSRRMHSQLVTLGDALAEEAGLVGLFGVDFVLADESIWPVEVNPRLPASVEVLERAHGFNAVACHVEACSTGRLPAELAEMGASGKAIVYARRRVSVSVAASQTLLAANVDAAQPVVADIPCRGTTIEAGMPIATVLADADRIEDVEPALRERQAWLEDIVYPE